MIRQPLNGEMVHYAVQQVTFNGTLDGTQLSCGQLDMLDVLVYGYGGGNLCGRESNLGSQIAPFLYQVCIEWCSHTSACRGACTEVWEGLHGLAFTGSFPVAYGHFVQLHVCCIGMCKTSRGQSTLTDTLSQSSHSEYQHQ